MKSIVDCGDKGCGSSLVRGDGVGASTKPAEGPTKRQAEAARGGGQHRGQWHATSSIGATWPSNLHEVASDGMQRPNLEKKLFTTKKLRSN